MAMASAAIRLLRQIIPLVACILAVALGGGRASADPIPVGQIRMDGLRNRFAVPGGAYAGEFIVNAGELTFTPAGLGRNGVDSAHFVSFCVETTEFLQLHTWYDAELNTESRNTNRAVQSETAYLYSRFVRGDLAGYRYFDDVSASDEEKAASARALQEVIWYYQDPVGFAARYGEDAFAAGGYFRGAAMHKVLARHWHSNLAAWIQDSGPGMGKVRIINLWDAGNARQDTLVMIPLPAPALLGAAGLGFVALGSARSRRRIKARIE